jgi:hypothetical protein
MEYDQYTNYLKAFLNQNGILWAAESLTRRYKKFNPTQDYNNSINLIQQASNQIDEIYLEIYIVRLNYLIMES